jgi:hypothetical protein
MLFTVLHLEAADSNNDIWKWSGVNFNESAYPAINHSQNELISSSQRGLKWRFPGATCLRKNINLLDDLPVDISPWDDLINNQIICVWNLTVYFVRILKGSISFLILWSVGLLFRVLLIYSLNISVFFWSLLASFTTRSSRLKDLWTLILENWFIW